MVNLSGRRTIKRHHRTPPFTGGFQHYRAGCLCQQCPNYFVCRLATKVIVSKNVTGPDNVTGPVTSSRLTNSWEWNVSGPMSLGERRVFEILKAHPNGLTLRKIAMKACLSTRHTLRCVRRLAKRGLVRRLIDVRKEFILKTNGTHQEMVDIVNRYVVVPLTDNKPNP